MHRQAERPNVVVVVPPARFLEISAVKKALKIDGQAQNDELQLFADAAVAEADGPAGWLNRCLGPQTLELRQRGFGCWERNRLGWRFHATPGQLALPYPELINVVSVAYTDQAGTEQTLDPTLYRVRGRYLVPAPGKTWPSTYDWPESVRIRYRAGYVAPGSDPLAETLVAKVPPDLVRALMLVIGGYDKNREQILIAAGAVGMVVNPTADDALGRYRFYG